MFTIVVTFVEMSEDDIVGILNHEKEVAEGTNINCKLDVKITDPLTKGFVVWYLKW